TSSSAGDYRRARRNGDCAAGPLHRPLLRAQAVQHDVEVEAPLLRRRRKQRGPDERPDLGRPEIPPHRAGALRARNDLRSELFELRRARLLAAVNDALVQAGRRHRELRGGAREIEERLAGIVRGERLLRQRADLRDMPFDDRIHQVVLRRKAAEDGAVPHAGEPGDLADAGFGPRRGEYLSRRVEHPLVIPAGVCPQFGHATLASAGSVSTSASILATCRLRRSATKTTRARPTRTAAPTNA